MEIQLCHVGGNKFNFRNLNDYKEAYEACDLWLDQNKRLSAGQYSKQLMEKCEEAISDLKKRDFGEMTAELKALLEMSS